MARWTWCLLAVAALIAYAMACARVEEPVPMGTPTGFWAAFERPPGLHCRQPPRPRVATFPVRGHAVYFDRGPRRVPLDALGPFPPAAAKAYPDVLGAWLARDPGQRDPLLLLDLLRRRARRIDCQGDAEEETAWDRERAEWRARWEAFRPDPRRQIVELLLLLPAALLVVACWTRAPAAAVAALLLPAAVCVPLVAGQPTLGPYRAVAVASGLVVEVTPLPTRGWPPADVGPAPGAIVVASIVAGAVRAAIAHPVVLLAIAGVVAQRWRRGLGWLARVVAEA